ncbi:MAG: SLC13 family permease [Ignavibacteriaceae bacterium]
MISIIALLLVFILIAIRQVGNIKLQIWQIMLAGAFIVLITGQISVSSAFYSINLDVISFLFGMFIIGQALDESGLLSYVEHKFIKTASSVDRLVIMILLGMGFTSSILMNDTVAIIGTPIVLTIAVKNRINSKLLLLTLAFAITIGSTASPIGNPQNLLIAVNGNMSNPFLTFFKFLFAPTLLNLFVAYLILKIFYRNEFQKKLVPNNDFRIKDKKLASVSKISILSVFILIIVKITLILIGSRFNFKLTYIALISALPIILFSKRRLSVLSSIDWNTLIFFAAMFVLMQGVWNTGYLQNIINNSGFNITSIIMILFVSVILSQFISNVPLVALYLPLLIHLGVTAKELTALAAGSTIAGNLFILGAASNIIIIQNAEKRNEGTLTFRDFAKVGIPLTIINILIYFLFLKIL